ncbi:hypothetical protein ABIC03_007911 [Bradyrhizobium sp. RT6a]
MRRIPHESPARAFRANRVCPHTGPKQLMPCSAVEKRKVGAVDARDVSSLCPLMFSDVHRTVSHPRLLCDETCRTRELGVSLPLRRIHFDHSRLRRKTWLHQRPPPVPRPRSAELAWGQSRFQKAPGMTEIFATRREDAILEVRLDRPKTNANDAATSQLMGELSRHFATPTCALPSPKPAATVLLCRPGSERCGQ